MESNAPQYPVVICYDYDAMNEHLILRIRCTQISGQMKWIEEVRRNKSQEESIYLANRALLSIVPILDDVTVKVLELY